MLIMKVRKFRRKTNKLKRAIVIVFSLAFASSVLLAASLGYKYYRERHEYDEVVRRVEKQSEMEENEEDMSTEKLINPINFDELHGINPDAYAWITVSDTNIDYPVLQHLTENDYYLNHTINGVEGYPGSIYSETINGISFSDYITIFYGHNMKNGTMFGSLHKFEDEKFFDSHPDYYVYTEDNRYTFEIIGCAEVDNRHLLSIYNCASTIDRDKFLEDMAEKYTHNRSGVSINNDTKLLILSTCMSQDSDDRWIVIAKMGEVYEY